MNHSDLNWITNFIWGIADDVLRDLYVGGKYRDVILPMTVLRRLDAVIVPTELDWRVKTGQCRVRAATTYSDAKLYVGFGTLPSRRK